MADAGQPRTGWFKSRSGSVMHADGPDQRRALTDLGWDEISEQQAKDIVAAGTQLTVHSDTGDLVAFAAVAVSEAVRNESAGHAARSAAAKKAAETRRRNQAAQEAEARAAANSESDAVTTEG